MRNKILILQFFSGMDGLLEFYREECGLVVYNRAIPDFQIPTSGDLVDNILDLTYHLAKGRNCLVHCAGGSGRTGTLYMYINCKGSYGCDRFTLGWLANIWENMVNR